MKTHTHINNKISIISNKPECPGMLNNQTPKRKISICSVKSTNYVFNNFMKQYRRALDYFHIG